MGMQMLLQTTIPDVTWVTSDVRAWLCEHDVKFDKDIGHVARSAATAGSAGIEASGSGAPPLGSVPSIALATSMIFALCAAL